MTNFSSMNTYFICVGPSIDDFWLFVVEQSIEPFTVELSSNLSCRRFNQVDRRHDTTGKDRIKGTAEP